MSATTICHQELVRLQLVLPSKPENDQTENTTKEPIFSFLQSFTTEPKTETETEDNVYVHPLTKHSASLLSPQSLAMCTESLGSETGSDEDMSSLLQINDINSHIPMRTTPEAKQSRSNVEISKRKSPSVKKESSFPPPLTSIGSNAVGIMPHREVGRLVLRAVAVSSPLNYFEAERGDGRLRLHLIREMPKDSDMGDECEDDDDEEEEGMEVETCWEEEEEEEEKVILSRCNESRRGKNKMGMNWPPESFWVAT